MNTNHPEFKDLLGKTFVEVINNNNDELIFKVNDKEIYKLYHGQDCCENVRIEDICGDLNDLIGSPILQAEENSSSDETPEGIDYKGYESYTWTFYRIATIKGQVVIRWLGESNGYYSESVDFCRVV